MSKLLFTICSKCNNKIAVQGTLCNFCQDEELEELEKCKNSPYYYATKYLLINDKPFTTMLTEEEFNKQFKKLLCMQ